MGAGTPGVAGEAARKNILLYRSRALDTAEGGQHGFDSLEGERRDVARGASPYAIYRRRAVRRLLSTSYILLLLSVLLWRRLGRLCRLGATFARGATSGDDEHGDYEGACYDLFGDRFWLVFSVTTVTLLLRKRHACQCAAASCADGWRVHGKQPLDGGVGSGGSK